MIGSDWNDISTRGLLFRRISLKSASLLMLAFSTNQSINEVGITSSSSPKVTCTVHHHDEKVYETITYLFTNLTEHAGKKGDYEKLALHYTLSAGLKFIPKTMDILIKITVSGIKHAYIEPKKSLRIPTG